MTRRTARAAVISVAASGAAALAATQGQITPVAATHGWPILNDNATHNVWRDHLDTVANNGTTWGANNLDEYTNLSINETSTWSDVRVTDAYELGAGLKGLVSCEDQGQGTDGLECRQWLLRFDNDQETELTTSEWKWLGCHEMGHTGAVGERYDEISCMHNRLSDLSPLLAQHTLLSEHDIVSINDRIDSS